MKKWLAAMLVCLLLLFPTVLVLAEGADSPDLMPGEISEADIIGAWQLSSLRMGKSTFAAQELGIDMVFEFREDHTVRGTYAESIGDNGAAEETWALDAEQAIILVSDTPLLKVRREDGVLFLLMDEEVAAEATGDLVFTRSEE